jgi:hypothetical protein
MIEYNNGENMFIRTLVWSLMLLCFASSSLAYAQDNGCDSQMKARLGVFTEEGLQYGGDVLITSCKGLFLRFVTGETINARDAFATEAGFDFFSMNISFIAKNFYAALPDEYAPANMTFMMFPRLEDITQDRSDLALDLNGAANTVVFKFSETGQHMFLQVFETSGTWF